MQQYIYLLFSGGLGNQLFQYAAGKSLQKTLGFNVKYEYVSKTVKTHDERNLSILEFSIDNKWQEDLEVQIFFNNHKVRYYIYRCFDNISFRLFKDKSKWYSNFQSIMLSMLGIYLHTNYYYCFRKKLPFIRDAYIAGLWHSVQYSINIINELKSEIHLKDPEKKRRVIKRIKDFNNDNTVAVHIRRGDYLTVPGYKTCSIQYYQKGINIIRSKIKNPIFLIFSDDIQWCRRNILGEDIVYIDDNNSDYIDFEMMRSCRYFIISNSTFSWWAAYLGEAKDKIVVTPKVWFKKNPKQWLNLAGWIEVDNK